MDRRTLLTISTAACLCGVYEAYALFVSPLLAPGVIKPPTGGEGHDPGRAKDSESSLQAQKYLAQETWTHDAEYQFRNDSGFFYFGEWDRLEETGEVRFRPFAMIWRPQNHDPEKDPYVIVSESALVKFAEKFELTKQNPGRVVGGALEGTVRVRGPDGLSIEGKNFHFAEQALRIWSDHAVKFRFGPHSGNGQGVELDLIPSTGPVSDDKPAISGMRTVRLIKDVQMKLIPGGKSQDQSDDWVFVNSVGSFEYDVEAHVAMFQKKVRVERPTGKNESDRLNCEVLTLIFEPEEQSDGEGAAAQAENAAPSRDAFDGGSGNLAFRRLRAEGPVVTVVSNRSEVQGWMNELTYDEQARVVALRDAKQVRLVQKNNELLCPEITAVLDQENQIERAVCRGAGQLFRYAHDSDPKAPRGTRPVELAAQWQTQLEKAPDNVTGLDLIEFKGHAVLNQTGKIGLKADIVRIWVTRPEEQPGGRRNREPGSSDDDKIQPRKLLAVREVAFSSPQISGHTEQLEVWFDEGSLPPPPASTRETGSASQRVLKADSPLTATRSTPNADFVFRAGPTVLEPAASESVSSGRRHGRAAPHIHQNQQALAKVDDAPVRKPRKKQARDVPEKPAGTAAEYPLVVSAELIRVHALRDDGKTDISEVQTEGHVHVTQEHQAGVLPLDLVGDRLRLWNYSESNQVLHVRGRPAQVRDRGMQLEGPDIQLDRGNNDARVIGAGVLRLPMTKDLNGKPLDTPELLNIFWQERMDFDGQLARFFNKVRTELKDSEIRCAEMHVTFTRRISFSKTGSQSQNTDVQYVVCRDGVDLKNNEYEQTRLVGVRTARGFEFTIDQVTGRMTAQGPGTIESWRRGTGKRAGLGANSNVVANRSLAAESAEWEYTRIDFAGKMDGNTNDRLTTFRDRVRVVYGPVALATDTIDEDDLPKDGGWMRCEELELMQQPETKSNKAYVTMKATGNAKLEGRSFHALAHMITYDELQGLYVLHGDGRRDATVWHERKVGAARSAVPAQRMEFVPARNFLKVINASSGQAVQ